MTFVRSKEYNPSFELKQQIDALNNSAIVSETDVEGSITFVNDFFCTISGYSREELIGKNHRILKSRKQPDRLFAGMWAAISQGKTWSGEVCNKRKDGTYYWVMTTITPFYNNTGKIEKFVSIRFDISSIKEFQEAQKTSEEEFRQLAENAPIFIVKINRNYEIEYINRGIGFDKEDVIGLDMLEFIPINESGRIKKIVDRVFKTGNPDKYEVHGKLPGGIQMWFSTSIGAIKKDGEIKSVLLIAQDISEKKVEEEKISKYNNELEEKVLERTKELIQTKKELEDAYEKEKELGRLKSRFVSTASHQFRTPLTVIQSNIGLLDMYIQEKGDGVQGKFNIVSNRIQAEIKRMTDLMNEVLLLGKINEGNIQPNLKLVDIIEPIMDVVSNYNEIQEDGRKISIEVDGNPKKIRLDINLIGHVFSNLISNAFKYSIGKLPPQISICFQKKEVTISVKDNGLGIPPEDIKHLFEPFYRASNVGEITGSGLGLSIVKEYVELNKGSIHVKSKINTGSEFIITFKPS